MQNRDLTKASVWANCTSNGRSSATCFRLRQRIATNAASKLETRACNMLHVVYDVQAAHFLDLTLGEANDPDRPCFVSALRAIGQRTDGGRMHGCGNAKGNTTKTTKPWKSYENSECCLYLCVNQ